MNNIMMLAQDDQIRKQTLKIISHCKTSHDTTNKINERLLIKSVRE